MWTYGTRNIKGEKVALMKVNLFRNQDGSYSCMKNGRTLAYLDNNKDRLYLNLNGNILKNYVEGNKPLSLDYRSRKEGDRVILETNLHPVQGKDHELQNKDFCWVYDKGDNRTKACYLTLPLDELGSLL